jgi:hypothetical protein
MAIEGPLKELSIHDMFQLLDLSRKTGRLRVTSEVRADEGVVYFDGGRVAHASIRSKPLVIEDILLQSGRVTAEDLDRAREFRAHLGNGVTTADVLVQAGAITIRDVERLERQQVETTVFELMSWREGFFTFEEIDRDEVPAGARLQVATESLLMEAARRIDEWSRIVDVIPDVQAVPVLAPLAPEHETQLDLLPHEWEVLSMIDGKRDLRTIADILTRSEFDVAKIAYGLVTTGVIEIRRRRRDSVAAPATEAAVAAYLDRAFTAIGNGDLRSARAGLELFLELAPDDPDAGRARTALNAVQQLLDVLESPEGA